VVSDEQMYRAYLEFPEDKRIAWSNHTLHTYEQAESRRAYRQAHVLKHWDETDRRILFRLILGEIPKQMTDALGMTRQAIEARINKMLKKTGLDDRTQLILWFLGFIALRSHGKTFPRTTLIESCENDRSLLQSRRSSRQQ
jgi:DNA-binding CsgD family transcriptional regulator